MKPYTGQDEEVEEHKKTIQHLKLQIEQLKTNSDKYKAQNKKLKNQNQNLVTALETLEEELEGYGLKNASAYGFILTNEKQTFENTQKNLKKFFAVAKRNA